MTTVPQAWKDTEKAGWDVIIPGQALCTAHPCDRGPQLGAEWAADYPTLNPHRSWFLVLDTHRHICTQSTKHSGISAQAYLGWDPEAEQGSPLSAQRPPPDALCHVQCTLRGAVTVTTTPWAC